MLYMFLKKDVHVFKKCCTCFLKKLYMFLKKLSDVQENCSEQITKIIPIKLLLSQFV